MVFLRKGSVYEKIIPTQKKNSAGSWRGIQSRKASKRCTENVHFKVVTYEDEPNSEHCSAHVFAQPIQTSQEKTESLHRGIQALTALAKASQSGQWSSSATLGTLGVHSLPFIAQLASP